jgi:transcriptional regulator with XRE-family HTH domain
VTQSIGARIRALRTEQKLTLSELASRCNLSTSYLSQVERDKTTPSLQTLTVIAGALSVRLRTFFETTTEAAYVVRVEDRAGDEIKSGHMVERQLAPNDNAWEPSSKDRLVVRHLLIPAGGASGPLPTYPGEELLLILSGQLLVEIADEHFTLAAGDSLHYDATRPHAWRHQHHETCALIWSSVAGSFEW